ncbi:MAG: DNA alkylation repair protein [Actinomycetota bacterium]
MAEPLKNGFDRSLVERIGAAAAEADAGVDRAGFERRVVATLDDLELKHRVNLIADELLAAFGGAYPAALPHVVRTAELVAGGFDDGDAWGTSMEAWPLCSVVERHGLAHPTESLAAMERLTRAFSCEFAIRPFLEHHLDQTIDACRGWTRSPHAAVRRLPSEGTRPYLPWGPKVTALLADPEIGIGLVTALRHDPDEVVRRSVANHLNDVARDHPERVASIAASWLDEPETEPGMVRHALRGLVKKGHPGAMAALGFVTDASVSVERFTVTPDHLHLGGSIDLEATIRSTGTRTQRMVVDFVIHHVGARGETNPKVFKWTTVTLEPGETTTLHKRRRIQTASTRRYHAGVHRVELQIAGSVEADDAFDLLDASP